MRVLKLSHENSDQISSISHHIVYTGWIHSAYKKKDILLPDDREGDRVLTKGVESDSDFLFPTTLQGWKLEAKTLPGHSSIVQGHRMEVNNLPANNGVVHVVLEPRSKRNPGAIGRNGRGSGRRMGKMIEAEDYLFLDVGSDRAVSFYPFSLSPLFLINTNLP
ncbi:uncharacterized protein EI90DRAFT_3027687 [Cantharellus anzutake]|uniref:uncharacterized protein n=1 Tax=Cantharellus anzutake TaxID=1750568 RepID=UPI001906A834|nr:uncharacterized protein EI90DRAFT_3027687 [Cantharellus anzutake]KAF8343964.1 hypothetical protein EI90DRAFT_3027687 [Cantharellus anzutake]